MRDPDVEECHKGSFHFRKTLLKIGKSLSHSKSVFQCYGGSLGGLGQLF